MPLTANKARSYSDITHRNSLQLAAATTVFEGSAIGINASNGRARPVVAGDLFAGFAAAAATSTRDVTGATPTSVSLLASGQAQLPVSGVTATNVGASVFATDDDTFALTGSTLVGEIVRVPAAGQAVVAFVGGLKRLSSSQVASAAAVVSGAVISGVWRGIPAAGPVMRVRMTGTGTVSMDSATGDLGAGTVTTAVYAATVTGTQIDDYAYPGDAARSIRFTLTGTAAVEVY